jgi:hypothetical protein
MQATLVDFAKDSVVYNITGATRSELENKLNLFFASEELPLKSDKGDEKTYQKGNKAMRVLFGVFVKYFKVNLSIKEQDGMFSVRILRDMNLVMSGGLVGIKKSRDRFNQLSDAFKVYFAN